jgi:predicted DCC family thiol-disulfide oxidoreductase YuxK
MTGGSSCTVYHDGACPLCRREIAFYRRRAGANAIRWVDVADADNADLGLGLDAAQAISRFHVRLGDGQLRSGAAGFAALWSALPGFRWAGRIAGAPPILWALELGYRAFLRIRPWLQRRVSDGCTIERPCDR